jgi:hypothetical protein
MQLFQSRGGGGVDGTTEIQEMLETVRRKTVLEWFKRFREKCESPEDYPKRERGFQMFEVSSTVGSRP